MDSEVQENGFLYYEDVFRIRPHKTCHRGLLDSSLEYYDLEQGVNGVNEKFSL